MVLHGLVEKCMHVPGKDVALKSLFCFNAAITEVETYNHKKNEAAETKHEKSWVIIIFSILQKCVSLDNYLFSTDCSTSVGCSGSCDAPAISTAVLQVMK